MSRFSDMYHVCTLPMAQGMRNHFHPVVSGPNTCQILGHSDRNKNNSLEIYELIYLPPPYHL